MFILEKVYNDTKHYFYKGKLLTCWIVMWVLSIIMSCIILITSELDTTMTLKAILIVSGVCIMIIHLLCSAFLYEERRIAIKTNWIQTYTFMSISCLYLIGILGFIGFNIFPTISLPAYLLSIFIIGELTFIWDKKQPEKKTNIFWFTVWRKFITFLELTLFMIAANGLYRVIIEIWKRVHIDYLKILIMICTATIWIVAAGIIVAIFYGYIKLNALKYTHKRKKK